MKSLICIAMLAVGTLTGCETTGSGLPHADSTAVTPGNAGPALCRDGTAPPCTTRQ